jgi:hypothetical protein
MTAIVEDVMNARAEDDVVALKAVLREVLGEHEDTLNQIDVILQAPADPLVRLGGIRRLVQLSRVFHTTATAHLEQVGLLSAESHSQE